MGEAKRRGSFLERKAAAGEGTKAERKAARQAEREARRAAESAKIQAWIKEQNEAEERAFLEETEAMRAAMTPEELAIFEEWQRAAAAADAAEDALIAAEAAAELAFEKWCPVAEELERRMEETAEGPELLNLGHSQVHS